MNSLLIAIGKYGLGTVIAGFLVYQLANQIPTMQEQHSQIIQMTAAVQTNITSIGMEVKESNENSEKIMRSICLILAKNQQQIQSCNQ